MEIISVAPEMSIDKMYCPSTDEVIFSSEQLEINEAAEAFIASWHGEVLDDPLISDPNLKKAWEEFREGEWQKYLEEMDLWEGIDKFLSDYKNPEWIVYDCTFHSIACGPVSSTVYYVVKKDTIIEEDSEFDEEHEEPVNNMSKEEFEIIEQQIKDLIRDADKEENKTHK